jgi:hypothetical protein
MDKPVWRIDNASWRFFVCKEHGNAHAALRWTWRLVAPNGMLWIGDGGFATLALCQADAITHGFVQDNRPQLR